MSSGWRNESQRHSLASKGIKSSNIQKKVVKTEVKRNITVLYYSENDMSNRLKRKDFTSESSLDKWLAKNEDKITVENIAMD